MLNKILSKVSRKSSKHSENRDGSHAMYSNAYAPTNSKSGELGTTKSGNVISSVPAGSFVSDIGKSYGNKSVRGGNLKLNGFVASSSYEALPGFRDVPNSEKQSLLVKKLNLCCVLFDFTDPTKHLKEKEIKRQTLLEVVDYLTSANGKFSETVMQRV